ncbi:MAG: hypothetical protein KC656_07940 [Myxococcales bacterium]|nr:hypothetical protein [Myxococcales bacterium]MCA9567758.1 hypothetical protein [Myxococcales bacterium]
MLLWFPLAGVAFASTWLVPEGGWKHPALGADVILVAEFTDVRPCMRPPDRRVNLPDGRSWMEYPPTTCFATLRVVDVVGGGAPAELLLLEPPSERVLRPGTIGLLHLVQLQDHDFPTDAPIYVLVDPSYSMYIRAESACGAVARTRSGALVAAYPTDTSQLPSGFVLDEPILAPAPPTGRQDTIGIPQWTIPEPSPEELCRSVSWADLLSNSGTAFNKRPVPPHQQTQERVP